MKSGFSHFDSSHRENFCAAVLLLTMELDDAVRGLVAGLIRKELGIEAATPLLSWGREARLAETDDDNYARVDLWLLFGSPAAPFYAFIEVKTHNNWEAVHVAHQVQDQAERRVARSGTRQVLGSVLLAPERLCRRVRDVDQRVRFVTWPQLIADLRALPSRSALTEHAIRHLEEKMERPAGIDRPMTLNHFEQATTTVACLRQFLVDCVNELGGQVHGQPLYMTPGDGQPLRGGDWAWHGLSVPFALGREKGRLGIYKYSDVPRGAEGDREALWLEAYLGEVEAPVAFVKFAPHTLATKELDAARASLKAAWGARAPSTTTG